MLGRKIGGPSLAMASSEVKDKMVHPSLHFNHSEEIKMPKAGHAVIKFRRVRTEKDESDENDPKYSHEIEVHGIEFKDAPDDNDGDEMPMDQLKSGLRKALKKE